MTHLQLYTKIKHLPSDLKSEVSDFIDFLLSKRKETNNLNQPKFGCAKGQIHISPDFDEPLEDFNEYTN